MPIFFVRFFAIYGMLLFMFVFDPSILTADTRTDYLINMLQTGRNYRLRVQAATTLGNLRSQKAVPYLVEASRDRDELVAISAAIALKQIGDPAVISELEKSMKNAPSEAARSQIALTIKILSEINQAKPLTPSRTGPPKYIVRVDAMGNSSKAKGPELTTIMRNIVVERLEKEQDVLLQPSEWKNDTVLNKVNKEKMRAYIVSGAIIRLDKVDNGIAVKLSLNVFTNPDYSLIMMPTAEASLGVSPSVLKPEDDIKTVTEAISAVTDSLISSIFDKIRQEADQ